MGRDTPRQTTAWRMHQARQTVLGKREVSRELLKVNVE